MRREQQRHRLFALRDARGAVGVADDVALVAHDAAHVESRGAGVVGERAGLVGRDAAAGEADVDVDDALVHAAGRRRGDRRRRVDGDRDPRARRGDRAEPARVDHLVGQQQVVAEAGGGHALDLAHRRAREVRCGRPSRWRVASAVDLCAFTCGRSRAPGSAADIVAMLWSNAAASTTRAGVVRSAVVRGVMSRRYRTFATSRPLAAPATTGYRRGARVAAATPASMIVDVGEVERARRDTRGRITTSASGSRLRIRSRSIVLSIRPMICTSPGKRSVDLDLGRLAGDVRRHHDADAGVAQDVGGQWIRDARRR